MKHLQNLGKILSKQEQQSINGGYEFEGNWAIYCNQGDPVYNAPDCEPETTTWACLNLGGFAGTCLCVGAGCE